MSFSPTNRKALKPALNFENTGMFVHLPSVCRFWRDYKRLARRNQVLGWIVMILIMTMIVAKIWKPLSIYCFSSFFWLCARKTLSFLHVSSFPPFLASLSLSLSPHYESHENPDIARLNRATPSTESKFPVPVTFLGIYVRTNEAEEWVVLVDVSELKNFSSSVPRERNFCNETLLPIAKFNNLIPLKALAQY